MTVGEAVHDTICFLRRKTSENIIVQQRVCSFIHNQLNKQLIIAKISSWNLSNKIRISNHIENVRNNLCY